MATENCSDTSESEVGRRRHRFLSCVDWRCDLAGIGPDTAVRWVLNRDTKAIVWLNLRERENGPWVMGTRSEEEDLEQTLLREHPEFVGNDELPGFTTGSVFPAWVHEMHFRRDDGRWEFMK
jgi:hypothetical protein